MKNPQDTPTETTPLQPLQMLDVEAAGYCDPETGICEIPQS